MPGTTICRSWSQRRMMMPLSITFSTRTPSSVPSSVPRPPVRLVPPRITAAITVSSKPRPAVGWPVFISEERIMPGERRQQSGDDEDEELEPFRAARPESRAARSLAPTA